MDIRNKTSSVRELSEDPLFAQIWKLSLLEREANEGKFPVTEAKDVKKSPAARFDHHVQLLCSHGIQPDTSGKPPNTASKPSPISKPTSSFKSGPAH